MRRRTYLRAIGAAGVSIVAGCGSATSDDGPSGTDGTEATGGGEATDSGTDPESETPSGADETEPTSTPTPEPNYATAWTKSLGSRVRTGLAVDRETVYFGTVRAVHALSIEEGTERWTVEVDNPSGQPVVADGTVYLGDQDDTVRALSTADGTEQWSYAVGTTLDRPMAVRGDTVFVGARTDGRVHAVSTGDGSARWTFDVDGDNCSGVAATDDAVYVNCSAGVVYALSTADGSELWRNETGGSGVSTPVVDDDTVYVAGPDNSVYAVSTDDGTRRWQYEPARPAGPVAVAGDTVYAVDSDFRAYAVATDDGSERWTYGFVDNASRGVTAVDGTFYAGTRGGNVYAIDTASADAHWFDSRTGSVSGIAVRDGVVFAGNRKLVYALEDRTA